ncbi:MAG: hypothetical protein HYU75_11360, partial [Betaproteobacteria bacterium]|nr:hypothetical protein [Betaproteobacteria bacterium]
MGVYASRDAGVRQRRRLDLAPRGPSSQPRRRLQQRARGVLDPRHRRALGERLHLRGKGRRAFRSVIGNLAKVAHGICDDLLTTSICATAAPVLICPAMNVKM